MIFKIVRKNVTIHVQVNYSLKAFDIGRHIVGFRRPSPTYKYVDRVACLLNIKCVFYLCKSVPHFDSNRSHSHHTYTAYGRIANHTA